MTIKEDIRRGKQRGPFDLKFWPSQKQIPFFWEGMGAISFIACLSIQIKSLSQGSGTELGTMASFLFFLSLSDAPTLGVGTLWGCGSLGRPAFL